MRITQMKVQNFRSFGPTVSTVNLGRGIGYHVFAGANASGKTNLLEAIRWVTGNRMIGADEVQPWDFHCGNTHEPIVIEATIDPPLKIGDTYNKFSDVNSLRFEAREYRKKPDTGDLRCEHYGLDRQGQKIMTGQTIPLKKGTTLTDSEKQGKQQVGPVTVREIRSRIPVYYLDNASYSFHLTLRQGSLLFRLGKVLREDLLRDSNMIEWEGKLIKRIDAVSKILGQLGLLLKTDRVNETLETMSAFLTAQLQVPKDALSLEICLPGGDELIKKLDLLACDGAGVPHMPIERLGRGCSALGIVALFRALNKFDDDHEGAIILIEEPEIFLGSHLRSLFAATLHEFASKGNQVILVTHSAEFFDPHHPETAVLVKKSAVASSAIQWPTGAGAPTFDVALKFIEPNLSKMIFSKKLLFVEGPDDFAALSTALELLNLSPAYHGLQIVQLGGKGNITHLAAYARSFAIPFVSLLDADASGILSKLDATGATWRTFDPDLEGALRTRKQEGSNSFWVAEVVRSHGTWSGLKSACPDFVGAIEAVLAILDIQLPQSVVPSKQAQP